MTFAHELQHHVQRIRMTRLWAVNTIVPKLPRDVVTQLGLTWCDIPHEREARLVSKRVAESLLGTEAVRRHIEDRIEEGITPSDIVDWTCIRHLDVGVEYDLAAATRAFFPRLKPYRSHLLDALSILGDDPAFKDLELDELLEGHVS